MTTSTRLSHHPTPHSWRVALHRILPVLLLLLLLGRAAAGELPDEFQPDFEEVRAILSGGEAPMGVMFMIRGMHEAALAHMLPRLQRHLDALHSHYPQLHLVVISYGEEIRSLTTAARSRHRELHASLARMIETTPLDFHVCGAFAAGIDLNPEDFPPYLDVVPSSTAQYEAYRALDYLPVMMGNP